MFLNTITVLIAHQIKFILCYSSILLIHSVYHDTLSVSVEHRDVEFAGCSDTEKEYLIEFDGEELFHSDFIRERGVGTAPDFADHFRFPGFYETGVAQMEVCKKNLGTDIRNFKFPDEQLGKTSTLHLKL